jgi:hypothetical protein
VTASDAQQPSWLTRSQRYFASALAVIVSLISLGVALSANRTQERLLAASVWPALEFGTGNRSDDGADEITLVIGNSGVGPARLRGFQLYYDGEHAPNVAALLQRCCGLGDGATDTVTSGTRGRVLKAGDQIVIIRLPKATNAEDLWQRFNRERFRVEAHACYCSVLDDCWNFDSTHMDPAPVASCPVLSADEEWSG